VPFDQAMDVSISFRFCGACFSSPLLSSPRFLGSKGNFVDHWDEIKDCTVIYLNNENGWFKEVGGWVRERK